MVKIVNHVNEAQILLVYNLRDIEVSLNLTKLCSSLDSLYILKTTIVYVSSLLGFV